MNTYDPSSVSLIVAGIHNVTTFSPDAMITITKNENFFTTSRGGTGSVERIKNSDSTYNLTIHLDQTSPSNSVLNLLSTLDHISERMIFPVICKDLSGSSVFYATSCWIESPPQVEYTSGLEERVWTIKCAELLYGLGGNNDEDEDVINRVGQLAALASQFGANRGIF